MALGQGNLGIENRPAKSQKWEISHDHLQSEPGSWHGPRVAWVHACLFLASVPVEPYPQEHLLPLFLRRSEAEVMTIIIKRIAKIY